MECNHKFQGHKDGVTCLLCGLKMTAAEYAKYPTSPKDEKPSEKATTEPGPKPAAPDKKPRKPRNPAKKKEGGTNE